MCNDIFKNKIFGYFKDICAIPHGSGNMKEISDYCVSFAKEHQLDYYQDESFNVIIYKDATNGYEHSDAVILQAHLDMVCQKNNDNNIDFDKDGIDVLCDDKYIFANNTTLGADNGIAVAMIMSILSSTDISHPPIEAVFTTDEEIGMIGASKLDLSLLKGKRFINLDAEEEEFVTLSCAGGADCTIILPIKRYDLQGFKIEITIDNLKGGHSGVDIDKNRENANIIMGKCLDYLTDKMPFHIISVNGGTKDNAIPFCANAKIVAGDTESAVSYLEDYFINLKSHIKDREEEFTFDIKVGDNSVYKVLDKSSTEYMKKILSTTPNGILEMNSYNKDLVETSLNLGILSTEETRVLFSYALRSNNEASLDNLMDKMTDFGNHNNSNVILSGKYLPWEYNSHSDLCQKYIDEYYNVFGKKIKSVAIHAGLECSVFTNGIKDIDCIAVGPDIFGAHTVSEKVSIRSVERVYDVLVSVLEKLI